MMGVTCVANVPIPEGKNGPQVVDQINRRLEQLGASKTGTFSVDCETYQSEVPTAPKRHVNVLHNSETPATCYAIMDNGMCLLADNLFDLLMMKIQSLYKPRKVQIESKGQRYELRDFIIKVGSVTQGPTATLKGILVEVEYCPCSFGSECWDLMKEFMQGFLGNCVENPNNHFKTNMESEFTSADTVQQYLEHFNNFRKSANTQLPAR